MEKKIDKELTITRIFNASRELVWKVWTDAKHIQQWWGPKGFTNPVCEWNTRVGEKIFIQMKGPDNRVYPMDGIFDEIIKPEKIVFTSAALDKNGNRLFEIINTITFVEDKNKTKLILHFTVINATPEAAPHLAGMETGWNMSLDKLTDYLHDQK